MFFKNKNKTCIAVHFIRSYAGSIKDNRKKMKLLCLARYVAAFEDNNGIVVKSNNFTYEVCENFAGFLRCNANLRQNTVRNYIQIIYSLFRKMSKRGFKVDFSFEEFHVPPEQKTSVYLTMEEINKIYTLKLKNKDSEITRDLFIVGCLTGLRYSDYSRLGSDNITNGCITIKTKKTGESVIIPQHQIVRDILRKRNGNFPVYKKSAQSFNKAIKVIAKKAGLTEQNLIEYTQGNSVIRKTMKKYELITSHTARRSFATNAYLSKIPTAMIMLITGHRTEQMFFKYICIEKKENARKLSEYEFFTNN